MWGTVFALEKSDMLCLSFQVMTHISEECVFVMLNPSSLVVTLILFLVWKSNICKAPVVSEELFQPPCTDQEALC